MNAEEGYRSAFISVSGDCPSSKGTAPDKPGTVAAVQYEFLFPAPYVHTQADVLWETHARRGGSLTRAEFFAKPQACLRSSPLGKKYGWGLHFDSEGRIALIGRETAEYARLAADPTLEHRAAMRSMRD